MNAKEWTSLIDFEGEDHFGLNLVDIRNSLYRDFRFFRIWFLLQRHRDFAFKPYFTNFRANVIVNEYS